MKKMTKLMKLLTAGVIVTSLSVFVNNVQSQPPAPDGQSNGGNVGVTPIRSGNGAPIGTGSILLISLIAGYGAKKMWNIRAKLEE